MPDNMGSDHEHTHHSSHSSGSNIKVAFWLNTFFALLEVAGGLYTNSVAILSDALHDFGDSLSLGLAYYFQKKSAAKRDKSYSYGYKRFSLLGAIINSIILVLGSAFIISAAVKRLANPVQPDSGGMLVLAVIGIAVNTAAMLRLRKGKSINERVVSLHFLEDVLGWVAVLIGALIMSFADVPILDPILSIGIAGFILFNVFRNLRITFRIILQGMPADISEEEIRKSLKQVKEITGLHDVHVWTMDGQYNICTVHVIVRANMSVEETEEIKNEIRKRLLHLNIEHATIETETASSACNLTKC